MNELDTTFSGYPSLRKRCPPSASFATGGAWLSDPITIGSPSKNLYFAATTDVSPGALNAEVSMIK
jgi:hypothetical protein